MQIRKLSSKTIQGWMPIRKADSHKGDYGHALIIAGSKGMSGASVLCAAAALRGGSGLVTVAVPESQYPIVAKKLRPEAMILPLPETAAGSFSVRAAVILLNFLKKRRITSVAIGPGLSRNSQTVRFVKDLFYKMKKNRTDLKGIVLDADGFLALKSDNRKPGLLSKTGMPVIVTPHAGELAKFCDAPKNAVQKNRIEFARKFAKLNQVVCVLKGHKTIVTDGSSAFLNSTGNPGMATGGSGDVLSGLIAALIPQIAKRTERGVKGIVQSDFYSTLSRASCIGVYIHGLAGDLAKKAKTEMGMIAGDIVEMIPEAFKKVGQK